MELWELARLDVETSSVDSAPLASIQEKPVPTYGYRVLIVGRYTSYVEPRLVAVAGLQQDQTFLILEGENVIGRDSDWLLLSSRKDRVDHASLRLYAFTHRL